MLQLAVLVVAARVGHAAEARRRELTIGGVGNERERAGTDEEAVGVVGVRDGGATVDALAREAEVGVVSAMDVALDDAGHDDVGRERPVIAERERATVGGCNE